MQEALKILDECKKNIWPEVKKYLGDPEFPEVFEVGSEYAEAQDKHWEIAGEYPLRKGKYVRPALLMLTAEAMGVERSKVVKTAAAMQISEEWLLIHDDFEDGSVMRRGKLTLHKLYGDELAVNAGDTLHILMWKILRDNERVLGKEKTFELIDEFHTILMRTVLGQSAEILWTKKDLSFKEKDWYFIADGKTSYYTIAGPMRLGAIIAEAGREELDLLAEFGRYMGRCFQLVDDVLDVTSDFKGLKEKGNDIYEGKRTVLLSHLVSHLKGKDKERALDILKKGREGKNKEEVDWIMEKMESTGSIDYAKSLAEENKERAFRIFDNELLFLTHDSARDKIRTIMNFVLNRDH